MTKPIESAFPVFDSDGCFVTGHSGLSKREYFAAIAMQGLMEYSSKSFTDNALDAVRQADALIAALDNEIPD